jgi:hypothetical protein
MSHYYGIGDAAKKLHQNLTESLAGPLQAYLPQQWITEILDNIGYKFRSTTFSPSDHSLGVHRPIARSRLLMQPGPVTHPSPSRSNGTRARVG